MHDREDFLFKLCICLIVVCGLLFTVLILESCSSSASVEVVYGLV